MIRGYAAVFNAWAEIVPGLVRERIAPGSFRRTLRDADVRALLNHDPNYVLGRNKAGTLELREDKHGLAVEIEPPDCAVGARPDGQHETRRHHRRCPSDSCPSSGPRTAATCST